MSYNIINTTHITELAISSLFILLVLKLILSSDFIGLGIPGGLIGPTLIIGATAGAAIGIIGNYFLPDLSSPIGFYAMMAATLKAPLSPRTHCQSTHHHARNVGHCFL